MSERNNPFEMMERLFDQMSRQFDEVSRSWGTGEMDWAAPRLGTMGIDLADHGDEFVVTADVPGFEKDDVDLRILDDTLHIEARHERSSEEEAETYLRHEREHRSLSERVALPEPVDREGIEAKIKNGVLTVRLPKAEPTEASGHQIDIE